MATKTVDQLTAAIAALLTQEFEIYDPAGSPKSLKITGLQLLTLFFGGASQSLVLGQPTTAPAQITFQSNVGGGSTLNFGQGLTSLGTWGISAPDDNFGIEVQSELFLNQIPGQSADLTITFDEIDLNCLASGFTMNGLTGFSGTVTPASFVGKTLTFTNGILTAFA
jgi:hypothetical protein